MSELGIQFLALDEFEAVRLADYEGLYHDQAAQEMGISRQSFGLIIKAARKKLATAIIKGMALEILPDSDAASHGCKDPSEE